MWWGYETNQLFNIDVMSRFSEAKDTPQHYMQHSILFLNPPSTSISVPLHSCIYIFSHSIYYFCGPFFTILFQCSTTTLYYSIGAPSRSGQGLKQGPLSTSNVYYLAIHFPTQLLGCSGTLLKVTSTLVEWCLLHLYLLFTTFFFTHKKSTILQSKLT